MPYTYETNGAAIYEQSRTSAESDLARFDKDEEIVAVRMIHAAGMVKRFIEFSRSRGLPAQLWWRTNCDARMVSEGITRATSGRQ